MKKSNIKCHHPEKHTPICLNTWQDKFYYILVISLLTPTLFKVVLFHYIFPFNIQMRLFRRNFFIFRIHLPNSWIFFIADYVYNYTRFLLHILRRQCYWRSLILFDMISRFGFKGNLHIGIISYNNNIDTHYWITVDSILLADVPERCDQFEVFTIISN